MSASDWTESSAGLLSSAAGTATAMNGRLRRWPAVVIVLLLAASVLIPAMIAPGSFPHFMVMVFGPILGTVAFGVWWLVASRAPLRARFQGPGVFYSSPQLARFGDTDLILMATETIRISTTNWVVFKRCRARPGTTP